MKKNFSVLNPAAAMLLFMVVAANAQTGGFLQRQPPQTEYPSTDQNTGGSGLPSYCADPNNSTLLECTGASTGQSSNSGQPASRGPTGLLPRTPPRDVLPLGGLNGQTSDIQLRDETAARLTPPSYNLPEPSTEFQRWVQAATGKLLPIFGASLFQGVPSTFAPVDRIPVAPGYVVGPGDEIQVRIWGQLNSSQRLTVDRSGSIYIPEVGPINVAGLTFAQLEPELKSAIGRVYRNFDLTVNLGQLRSIQMFVVGQARHPGSYTVSSLSTLVNVLFASGGPSSRGSLRHIQLKRAGKVIAELDLYDLILNGDTSGDAPILPGDILFIPAVGPQVAVSGSVDYPAIYELKDTSNLGEVLRFAGGLSPVASARHAAIERIDPHSALTTSEIALDKPGLATDIQNGDIVRVLDVVPRFENAVTLRGNVADESRFPWHAGMRVSDLIPDKGALLTRDYWRERNGLGINHPTERTDELNNPNNPMLASTGNPASLTRFAREQGVNTSSDRSLGAAQSNATGQTSRKFDVRNQIQPPAPDIDWDYAVVERLDAATLATKLISFNLSKAVLDRDPAQDPVLQPGDVVTIFSKADVSVPQERRNKYVRVEGEVGSAGVYSVQPGETLRGLLMRAGGLTSNAYLFGLQFTRESTQREQQQRFSEFLDTLETQINESASNLGGRVLSVNDAAVAQSTLASQRALVQKLRETPPSGRIVLGLEPSAANINDLPDLPLEDGDRIYIPNRPDTINVIGTVSNQASFVYDKNSRLGEYLQQAGGPSRFADRSHMFVIRADGSVVSKPASVSIFGHNIESLRMFPGDTLVVPTYVNKQTFLRGLTDWSQVVGNFALGTAAINVLK